MPGAVARNFRTPDFKEQLGILLLRHVSAVAPQLRADDFGIDAVCTILLDHDDHRRQVPGRTFYVQLKSQNVDEVVYERDAARWLMALQLPFFLARVSLDPPEISLYPITQLRKELAHARDFSGALRLTFSGQVAPPCETLLSVKLGPPCMRWGVRDLSESDRSITRSQLVDLLDAWLSIETFNADYRHIGAIRVPEWETNQLPTVPTSLYSFRSQVVSEAWQKATPYLMTLASAHLFSGRTSPSSVDVWKRIFRFACEDGGVDPREFSSINSVADSMQSLHAHNASRHMHAQETDSKVSDD